VFGVVMSALVIATCLYLGIYLPFSDMSDMSIKRHHFTVAPGERAACGGPDVEKSYTSSPLRAVEGTRSA